MTGTRRNPLTAGVKITSLGTLASRVLGLAREVANANVLGMSQGGVMDAFAIAFQIPNLFRGLFGEGALAVSYLPVVTTLLEQDRKRAWRLTSVALTWLTVILSGLVVLGEAFCGLIWLGWGSRPGMSDLVGLTAVMLPYLLFICLAAQVAATLQAMTHFSTPALTPTLLNLCWLIGACLIAPRLAPNRLAQAYAIAICVLVAGVLQLAVQLPVLRRLGFRYDYNWPASRQAIGKIVRTMLPMVAGLAITQINTLMDRLIAWTLTATAGEPTRIGWLGFSLPHPLRAGAVASIYYGERLYQFPLGILGMAVATTIFPLLSRHAARGDRRGLGADLTLGLRLVIFLGIPSGLGLVMLSGPLARLLFQHGQFTADDAARTARMIACYSSGVWAYCALPVVVRGYYALGDRLTPLKIGAVAVALNLAMDLTLVWRMAEAGLATSTSIAAGVQVLVLVWIFSRRNRVLDWWALGGTTARTLLATLAMAIAGYAALAWLGAPAGPGHKLAEAVHVALPLAAAVAGFFAVYRMIGCRELRDFFVGPQAPDERR
jgi:putative peptidoglycan lipid II flippase